MKIQKTVTIKRRVIIQIPLVIKIKKMILVKMTKKKIKKMIIIMIKKKIIIQTQVLENNLSLLGFLLKVYFCFYIQQNKLIY